MNATAPAAKASRMRLSRPSESANRVFSGASEADQPPMQKPLAKNTAECRDSGALQGEVMARFGSLTKTPNPSPPLREKVARSAG